MTVYLFPEELGAIRHAGGKRRLAALLNQLRIQLDAHAARAEITRGRDHDASVARAQVIHHVVRANLRFAEHLGDGDVGGGDVGRVEPFDGWALFDARAAHEDEEQRDDGEPRGRAQRSAPISRR